MIEVFFNGLNHLERYAVPNAVTAEQHEDWLAVINKDGDIIAEFWIRYVVGWVQVTQND